MSNDEMLKELGEILGDAGQKLTSNTAMRLTLASVLETNKKIEVLRAERKADAQEVVSKLEKIESNLGKQVDILCRNPAINLGTFFLAHKKSSSILGIMLLLLILIPNFELLPIFFKAILTLFGIPIDVVNAAAP
jgi:chorismate synthase